eukprot:3453560-Rhodomonas_salina.2
MDRPGRNLVEEDVRRLDVAVHEPALAPQHRSSPPGVSFCVGHHDILYWTPANWKHTLASASALMIKTIVKMEKGWREAETLELRCSRVQRSLRVPRALPALPRPPTHPTEPVRIP